MQVLFSKIFLGSDGRNIIHTGSRCHLGIGCGIQAGWRLTDRMTAGIYTGITCLSGSRTDIRNAMIDKSKVGEIIFGSALTTMEECLIL